MKVFKKVIIVVAVIATHLIFISLAANAQNQTIAVAHIDAKGVLYEPSTLANLVRIEIEKVGQHKVMDRYDMSDKVEREKITLENCYGIECLSNVGKKLEVDKIFSGSVERIGEKLVVSLRILNVSTSKIEQVSVMEYHNLQPEMQFIIELSVQDLLGIEKDEKLMNALQYYDAPLTNPTRKLINNGPRMGVSYLTGTAGERLNAPLEQGGYDSYPVISQFGYQYEVEYLSAGNFQGLFECLFMIGGLEQQLFIPSITLMNGFRDSKTGLEIAFGPSVSLAKMAEGYFEDGVWHRKGDWDKTDAEGNAVDNPNGLKLAIDRRGDVKIMSGWVWAVGKTFQSGHLNIPVNAYVSPNKQGWHMGLSVGFNVRKRKSY